MRRSELQKLSSDHVWARNHIKGFKVLVEKTWPKKRISIHHSVQLNFLEWLHDLEREVKSSYFLHKAKIEKERKRQHERSK